MTAPPDGFGAHDGHRLPRLSALLQVIERGAEFGRCHVSFVRSERRRPPGAGGNRGSVGRSPTTEGFAQPVVGNAPHRHVLREALPGQMRLPPALRVPSDVHQGRYPSLPQQGRELVGRPRAVTDGSDGRRQPGPPLRLKVRGSHRELLDPVSQNTDLVANLAPDPAIMTRGPWTTCRPYPGPRRSPSARPWTLALRVAPALAAAHRTGDRAVPRSQSNGSP